MLRRLLIQKYVHPQMLHKAKGFSIQRPRPHANFIRLLNTTVFVFAAQMKLTLVVCSMFAYLVFIVRFYNFCCSTPKLAYFVRFHLQIPICRKRTLGSRMQKQKILLSARNLYLIFVAKGR